VDYATGYRDGFNAGMAAAQMGGIPTLIAPATIETQQAQPRAQRKASAYSKAYGRAYKALRRKHTLKSGKLRKGYTHKRLVKLAHAEAKRRRKK
jgi:hypothetical protein